MSRIQWSIDSVKEFVDNKTDCKLLSTEYVNAKTKLKFKIDNIEKILKSAF